MTEESPRLGRVIARARELRGMTQADLADKVGVHENMVSLWEHGAVPSMARLGPLCRALGVRAEIFVDLPLRRLERYFVEE